MASPKTRAVCELMGIIKQKTLPSISVNIWLKGMRSLPSASVQVNCSKTLINPSDQEKHLQMVFVFDEALDIGVYCPECR